MWVFVCVGGARWSQNQLDWSTLSPPAYTLPPPPPPPCRVPQAIIHGRTALMRAEDAWADAWSSLQVEITLSIRYPVWYHVTMYDIT